MTSSRRLVGSSLAASGVAVLVLVVGLMGSVGTAAAGGTTSPTGTAVATSPPAATSTTAATSPPAAPGTTSATPTSATSSTASTVVTTSTVPPGADRSGIVWLCRPGLASNPCISNLTTTVVGPSGASHEQRTPVPKNPPIDCFYVYPTVSAQTTVNANLDIDPQERAVANLQASRFSADCRVYAPMYPQVTLSALGGGATQANLLIAYNGVLAAWKDYLANYNKGRGVVFIGHSQGASMLIRLLKSQVDPKSAVRKQMVSALLMGGNVTVPIGKTVGGDFKHIPACRSMVQIGCVVAYSSFLDPPPANSLFGRVGAGVSLLTGDGPNPKLQVLCVDPASLSGGTGTLQTYAPTGTILGSIGSGSYTPWVESLDQYSAHCQYTDGISWLQVNVIPHAGDTRPAVTQSLGPTWGLHLDDVNLALGNLVSLVKSQAEAYASAH
jgi:hypothetical protein